MLGDGAARGATPGPFARSSRKIHQRSPFVSPFVRTHSPLRHPAGRPRSRGAIRRFTPAILPTDAVLRPYSSSSRFFRSFLFRWPPSPLPLLSRPSFIAFFYRILYFPCHPVCAARLAPLHRVSFVSRRWPGITPAAIFTPGTARSDIQADECARASVRSLPMSLMRLPVFFFTERSRKNGLLAADK